MDYETKITEKWAVTIIGAIIIIICGIHYINNSGSYIEYNESGVEKYESGNYKGAIKDLTKSISIKENPNAFYNRGLVRNTQGDYSGAVEDFTKAIELNFKYKEDAYIGRAMAKGDLGDKQGELEDYATSIKIKPSYTAYYNRCILKGAMGDNLGVIEDCSNALKYKPNDPDSYNNIGYANQLLGNYDTAMKNYDMALSINKNHRKANENKTILSQMLRNK